MVSLINARCVFSLKITLFYTSADINTHVIAESSTQDRVPEKRKWSNDSTNEAEK